jgi:hypothetical protein
VTHNPFAAFNIEMPSRYREAILKYCRTGGNKATPEFAPFERQVDFWFIAFVIAVARGLDPVTEDDTYNATPATILTTDPERVGFLQLAVLGAGGDIRILSEPRKLFDYAQGVAHAGIPYLIQVLEDPDDRPLWALLTELEGAATREGRAL